MAALRWAVVVVAGLVSCVGGKSLCTGDVCTSTSQCDKWSGCYARRGSGAKVGRCLNRIAGARRVGDVCDHAGECDGCSECVDGKCKALVQGVAGEGYEEVLRQELEREEGMVSSLKGDLNQALAENKELKRELSISDSPALPSFLLRFIAAIVIITFILFLLITLRLLLLRSHRNPNTQQTAPEPDFYASDSSDESVTSETELELRNQHDTSEPPEDLDPEDPNTCKICFDSVINCILLDCGHMCVCLPCAKRLKNCPMCRKLIRKRKKIFKA
eukprot:TRINITY_DN9080_c0_g2_i1.p1 TRINITY_DN9080_c0_g2~~TRINITY_DN9080_c0_g2_i1.p1  ORF type:complete len:274 (+),score=82.07 TRINITY_DN9080_c0_g2_i1:97-918(+)